MAMRSWRGLSGALTLTAAELASGGGRPINPTTQALGYGSTYHVAATSKNTGGDTRRQIFTVNHHHLRGNRPPQNMIPARGAWPRAASVSASRSSTSSATR